MAVSSLKVTLDCDLQKAWEVVTSLENYSWRSDLSRVEVVNKRQFIEYTKDGYATSFTVTSTAPLKCWEFDMENDNMKGHWTGVFSSRNGAVEIEFTEEVTAKKLIMKPFVKGYLKKQQARYIADLKKALEL